MTVMHAGRAVGRVPRTGDSVRDSQAASQLLTELGIRPKLPSEFEAMVNQAAAFAEAAMLINAELLQKAPRRAAGVSTFVVNAAFAIEVYLKALTLRHGGRVNRKQHGLSELLRDLPSEAQNAVTRSIPHTIPLEGLSAAWDLAEILRSLNSAFVDWRYYYEKSDRTLQANIPQTIYALRVLHRACYETR